MRPTEATEILGSISCLEAQFATGTTWVAKNLSAMDPAFVDTIVLIDDQLGRTIPTEIGTLSGLGKCTE
jgi:photosystem II stability/assembly factor-like uncharacterized protein